MSGQKYIRITFGLVLSASLIAAVVSVLLVSCHYSRLPFELLNVICGEVIEREPETKNII